MNDLRLAVRQWRKHPVVNATIVLTVALLIGTCSVLYASMRENQLKLMPFPEHERVVKFFRVAEDRIDQLFPPALVRAYRERLSSLADVGVLEWREPMTLTEVGDPVAYGVAGVSASLLRVAGLTPIQGRLFEEADERTATAGAGAVIVSEQMWREKLDADPAIVGRELRLNDGRYTVVGVLPSAMRSTRLAFNTDLWLPLRFEDTGSRRFLWMFGRLKPGVSHAQAQAELETVATALEREHSPPPEERALYPTGFVGARLATLDRPLDQMQHGVPAEVIVVRLFLGLIVASVVGIACFNIALLLLSRVLARAREFSIRLSLGAGRWRVVRQVLGESILNSSLGGALGLAVSFWFHDLLRLQHVDARLDWRLYGLAAGGAVVLGALVALVPALQSASANLTTLLGVMAVVGSVGILACLVPARKAANLNPMEALRTE